MDPAARRLQAAALLDRYLGGALLPPHVPGDPVSLVVALRGSLTAHVLLDELAELYGVDRWDAETFRKYILEDALPKWKEGTHVFESSDAIVAVAPGCPVEVEVANDPRICGLCQATQIAMAEAGGDARARIIGTATAGLPACILHVARKSGA